MRQNCNVIVLTVILISKYLIKIYRTVTHFILTPSLKKVGRKDASLSFMFPLGFCKMLEVGGRGTERMVVVVPGFLLLFSSLILFSFKTTDNTYCNRNYTHLRSPQLEQHYKALQQDFLHHIWINDLVQNLLRLYINLRLWWALNYIFLFLEKLSM